MTANLSKYNFLLQDNTNNFVINSNKGDYNFDYLFTTYEDRTGRNDIYKKPNIPIVETNNKDSKLPKNTPKFVQDFITLVAKSYDEKKQQDFETLFKEHAREILTNESFKKVYSNPDRTQFKRNYNLYLDKLSKNTREEFYKLYNSFNDTTKKLYEEDKKYLEEEAVMVGPILPDNDENL
jgi:hypothetical protein